MLSCDAGEAPGPTGAALKLSRRPSRFHPLPVVPPFGRIRSDRRDWWPQFVPCRACGPYGTDAFQTRTPECPRGQIFATSP